MPSRKLPPNEEIVSLYRSGKSTGEIAEMFAVAPVTVTSLLRRIGEPRRSSAEASKLRTSSGRANPSRFWLGKKQSPETVEKRISQQRGEKHYLWKGGKDARLYRKLLKKEKCETCGLEANLGFHHINYDHYDDTPANLQVLCLHCHISLHKKRYWDAIHRGEEPPKSNAPIGWRRGV